MLIVFLLLNVFLLFTLKGFYFGEGISKESVENVISVLKLRNVTVKCNIPYSKKTVGTLSLLRDDPIKTGTIKDFEEQGKIDTSKKDEIEGYIKQKVESLGFPLSQFHLDTLLADDNGVLHVALYQEYEGSKVFSNFIKADFKNGLIETLDYKYQKITGLSGAQEIVPIYRILLKNSKEINNLVIRSIDIGFKEHVFEGNIKEPGDIPVWRIKTEEGQDIFFKAYTGEKL